MKSFEEERRKAKLSTEDFISIQQPLKKDGKINEIFVKAFGKDKLPKKKKLWK
jgi:hypothetical protein